MTLRKRWIIGLAALTTVLALVMAACSGAAAPAPAAEAPAAGAPAADAAPGERTKIVWWVEALEAELEEQFQQQFLDGFHAAHPDVELEMIWQESIEDVLRAAVQAGEGPDLIQTPGPSYLLEYQKAGFVLPLNEYAEQYGWQERVLPWAYESGTLDGELYGLPVTFESMVMLYNKSVLADHGLTPPTTRAEFENVCNTLQDAGLLCISYGNVGWQPNNEHLVGMWLNSYAGSDAVYEALTGARPWDDPAFVEAVEMLRGDIAERGYFAGSLEDYYSFDWDTQFATLAADQAGLMLTGTWGFRGAATAFADNPDNWDWAMVPAFGEGVEQGFDLAIGSTMSINAASEHPDAAAKVLDYLYGDPARAASLSSIFNYGEYVIPISYSPEDFPAETDPRVSRFFSEFGAATGEGRYGYTSWTFWPAEAETQLWKEVELVWSGEVGPVEYLAEHEALWQKARENNATPPVPQR